MDDFSFVRVIKIVFVGASPFQKGYECKLFSSFFTNELIEILRPNLNSNQ